MRSTSDCSTIISLGSLPVSAIILKLRRTFRVSLQCHLEATAGSRVCSSLCNAKALSGSVKADGGESGSLLNRLRSSGDSFDNRISNDPGEKGWLGPFPIKRSGNIKCCIQYEVPPTTTGILFCLWMSSISLKVGLGEKTIR